MPELSLSNYPQVTTKDTMKDYFESDFWLRPEDKGKRANNRTTSVGNSKDIKYSNIRKANKNLENRDDSKDRRGGGKPL